MKDEDRINNESGFSLVELLIVSVILMSIIGIMSGIVTGVQRSYTQQRLRTESLNDGTAALDMMTRLIRTAGNNPNAIAGLQPIDPGTCVGGVYRTLRIRSDWRGSTMSSYPDGDITDPYEDIKFFVLNNTLMKQESADGNGVAFLDNVTGLQFIYYDTANVMIVNPEVNHAAIARIDMTITMRSPTSAPLTFTSSAYVRQR